VVALPRGRNSLVRMYCFTITRLLKSDDAHSVLSMIRRIERETSVDYTDVLSLIVMHREQTRQPSRAIVYVKTFDDVTHFLYILEKTIGRRQIMCGEHSSDKTYVGSCVM
jgi:hypothetical protein